MKKNRENFLKPIFKWSGGKSKEINKIIPHIPKNYCTYFEPFLGAGAMWFYLSPQKSIVGDTYIELINFFNVIKSYKDDFINKINLLSSSYNEEIIKCSKEADSKIKQKIIADKYYYFYRDNEFIEDFDKAIKFYILRQLSFCGMLRFNKNGKFNVPYGWYKTLKKINQNKEKIYNLLDSSKIINANWRDTVLTATKKDFVFLDPPYTRKFQKYHPNGNFANKEHEELANWFFSKKTNALIILNKDEFTNSLYKNYIIEEYDKQYSIRFRDRMTKKDKNAIHFVAKNF